MNNLACSPHSTLLNLWYRTLAERFDSHVDSWSKIQDRELVLPDSSGYVFILDTGHAPRALAVRFEYQGSYSVSDFLL